MKEPEQILQLWARAMADGESAVLATVVKTSGSSYRLPGARLLLTSGGRRAGSVSGGCLEDDLVKKAWWLTESGPTVRRYDTTPDGEIGTEFGLGCNGIIHVLLERVTASNPAGLDLLREVRKVRLPAAIGHLVRPLGLAGQRVTLDTSGRVTHNLTNSELAASIAPLVQSQSADQDAGTLEVESGHELFVERLVPAVRLLVFGAGDDAIPVVSLAKHLGWQVYVIDGRSHYARPERFPAADEVIVGPVDQSWIASHLDPWTAAVLMTHSYSQDLAALAALSVHALPYLGILGPRKRTVQLLADLDIDPAKLAPALHGPMGLDIGADGPEQVALAAIAEIQAVMNGRPGGMLKHRTGSIHSPEETEADASTFRVRSIACA